MQIGPYSLKNPLILAPMAGISDRPFRAICREFGASLAFSEMITSAPNLRLHQRTRLKTDHRGEQSPVAVQLLGTDPQHMADSARYCVDQGAEIIDINMGCPARKVCKVAAGSALMRNQLLAQQIMEAVVNAVQQPVTVKIRSGWDPEHRNAIEIARIAELSGIQAITVHGRTRTCSYALPAEYDTVTAVKQAVSIPVIANGDIDSPEKARSVLQITGADAIMCGRAAQGRPWLFGQIAEFMESGKYSAAPAPDAMRDIVTRHLAELYAFYGKEKGVRIARKHIKWYLQNNQLPVTDAALQTITRIDCADEQLAQVDALFDHTIKVLAA